MHIVANPGSVPQSVRAEGWKAKFMATEGFNLVSINHEQQSHAPIEPLSSPHQSQAPHQNCTQPCAQKPDSSLDERCTLHRRQDQRSNEKRKRLIRLLVDTLKAEGDDPTADSTGRPRRRPRLVLLGNQQSLILGVVLSAHGDLAGLSRSMF